MNKKIYLVIPCAVLFFLGWFMCFIGEKKG
jgi:hypothetical protein